MTGLHVLRPGLLSTVQDLGRTGHARIGVPRGGAADPMALRIGNRLVGNPDDSAGVEMTITGGAFEFTSECRVVLTGADPGAGVIGPTGSHNSVALYHPLRVGSGDQLRCSALRGGARTYLCVGGGIDVPLVLGGRGTSLGAKFGGLEGRLLRAGDFLPIGSSRQGQVAREAPESIRESLLELLRPIAALRALEGPHIRSLGPTVIEAFWNHAFTVSARSDRTGIRLQASPASSGGLVDRMPSEGMVCGAVQFPPAEGPIVLLCDHPTTGGYPVIACVATADLWRLGQLAPGHHVSFTTVSRAEACALFRSQEHGLNRLLPPVQAARDTFERQSMKCNRVAGSCTIDLNADIGESETPEGLARDLQLMQLVTSVSIATGGHAGSVETMDRLVRAAAERGVAIGAHPGYPDRANFGRKRIDISATDLERSIIEQVLSLSEIAERHGSVVVHVKAHGALYHAAASDAGVAELLARAVRSAAPRARLVGPAGSAALSWWARAGLRVTAEAFADRAYRPDGTLLDRSDAGAVIESPTEAAEQAVRIAKSEEVRCPAGKQIPCKADTLCIHSDTPGALAVAQAVRSFLEASSIRVAAPEPA